MLDPGEVWLFRATGTVPLAPVHEHGDRDGVFRVGGTPFMTSATDVANILGTDGGHQRHQARERPGREHAGRRGLRRAGAIVTWTYVVTATTSTPLSNVDVVDDDGTPGTGDDLHPFVGGDTNSNHVLDPGETWRYTASGAAPAGLFGNVALAAAPPAARAATAPSTTTTWPTCSASSPKIAIVKAVNALDPLDPTAIERADGVTPELLVGAQRHLHLPRHEHREHPARVDKLTGVVDDNGTPGATGGRLLSAATSAATRTTTASSTSARSWLFQVGDGHRQELGLYVTSPR